MRALILVLIGVAATGCIASVGSVDEAHLLEQSVVYGTDDRAEYGATRGMERVRADATALLTTDVGTVTCTNATCAIKTTAIFDQGLPLCSSQRFHGQKAADDRSCTAFLVGPRLFATAGHCMSAASCAASRIVFGFVMNGATQTTSVPASEVYSCAKVVAQGTTSDWALFEVNRDVTGRIPYWVRYGDANLGPLKAGDPLTMIGHPTGLPSKIDNGAVVKSVGSAMHTANTDSFGGNSGAPVTAWKNETVEGILVAGNTDYRVSGNCVVVRTHADTGCTGTASVCPSGAFEEITNITQLKDPVTMAPLVPLHPAGIQVVLN